MLRKKYFFAIALNRSNLTTLKRAVGLNFQRIILRNKFKLQNINTKYD